MLPVNHSSPLRSLLKRYEWPCMESPVLLHVVLNHCVSWPCVRKIKGLKIERMKWPSVTSIAVCLESRIKPFATRAMQRCQKGNKNITNWNWKVKTPVRLPCVIFPSWKYRCHQYVLAFCRFLASSKLLTPTQLLQKAALARTWKGKVPLMLCLLQVSGQNGKGQLHLAQTSAQVQCFLTQGTARPSPSAPVHARKATHSNRALNWGKLHAALGRNILRLNWLL